MDYWKDGTEYALGNDPAPFTFVVNELNVD